MRIADVDMRVMFTPDMLSEYLTVKGFYIQDAWGEDANLWVHDKYMDLQFIVPRTTKYADYNALVDEVLDKLMKWGYISGVEAFMEDLERKRQKFIYDKMRRDVYDNAIRALVMGNGK